MENSNYTTKSETDRVFSVFETFGKDAEDTQSLSSNFSEPVLTMSSLGQLGRFGNQLFQYAFLRICANTSGAKVECSPWIGQTLFGHRDAPISHCLPPAIERSDVRENLFDYIPEFVPYLEKLANTDSLRVGAEALEQGLLNVDLWGFFQVPTHFLEPHKNYFQSLFLPVDDLKCALENGLKVFRSKGKTIVGIHVRRGDFIKMPLAGFTFVVPTKWWCNWLDSIWEELESPILFLCSDELDNVVHDFDRFCPVTVKDLNIQLPDRMKDLNIEFYIDFFMLSNCDVVGISNSIFSFVACMLNEHGKIFVRPHLDFSGKFAVFDPWNSEPLLYVATQSKFSKTFSDALAVAYVTQGLSGWLKCLLIYLPISLMRKWGIQVYLGYQIQGFMGVFKSLLSVLGLRSVWKTSELIHSK